MLTGHPLEIGRKKKGRRMLRRESEETGIMTDGRSLQRFFATPLMPCPYLPGQRERKVVTELTGPDADLLYEALTESGFRRSQSLVYKPACDGCQGCVPMRVRAEQFDRRELPGANQTAQFARAGIAKFVHCILPNSLCAMQRAP